MKLLICLISVILLASCGNNKQKELTEQEKRQAELNKLYDNLKANTNILTYDKYANEDKKGYAVQISDRIVALPFSLAQEASSVRVIYLGEETEPMARGYLWFDITQNMLFLQVSGPSHYHPELSAGALPDTLYGLTLFEGKMRRYTVTTDSIITIKGLKMATLQSSYAKPGTALFEASHKLAGVVTMVNHNGKELKAIYPASQIKAITDTLNRVIRDVSSLRLKTDMVYIAPEKVKSFVLETTYGNIEIALSDKLPEYQKNFIRLTSDGYYDSLLVHRVLRNFLIQTGAADTRHAKHDESVGWKGPGYSLPTLIMDGLYHKRGAVAASKLPDYINKNNRSDGSQFYIISGRTFNDEELDDLEKQKNITFGKTQREVYKTSGGAPYLDEDYTVFGEVISGMNVVDSIAAVATDKHDRPLKDIRLRTIHIIEK